MDKLVDLIEKFKKNHKSAKVKFAVFSFSVVGDELYLAQRNTFPMVGLYSAIGGKVDPSKEEVPLIRWPTSPGSHYVIKQGYERLKWTSIRELIEELYLGGDKLSSKDAASLDLAGFKIQDHATLFDANTGVICYTKVIYLPEHFTVGDRNIQSRIFNPSQRETGGITKMNDLKSSEINPLTKVALYVMRFNREDYGFIHQIPQITMDGRDGFPGAFGDGFRYHADFKEGKGFFFDYVLPNL